VILAASVLRYRAEKQTDTQTNSGENHTPATAVIVYEYQTKFSTAELQYDTL